MGPVDFIVIALICLAVGLSAFYVIRAKKKGVKCIGCPDGCNCSAKNGGCASCGCCGGEGHSEQHKTSGDE